MTLEARIEEIEIKIEDVFEKVSKGTPYIIGKLDLEELLEEAAELKQLYSIYGPRVTKKIDQLIAKINYRLRDILGFIDSSTPTTIN